MGRGTAARRRRSARRAQARVMPLGVGKAQEQDSHTLDEFALIAADISKTDAPAAPVAEEFASGPACGGCDHDASDHLGSGGPCTSGDCACSGYEAADEAAVVVTVALTAADITGHRRFPGIVSDLVSQAIADGAGEAEARFEEMLVAGLPPEHAETIRVRLEEFRLGSYADAQGMEATLPTEHAPGARVPKVKPGPSAPVTPLASNETVWSAIFCPEGKLTADGRAFAPGAIEWRDLPLTLMAMTETSEGGHIGAEVAGRIDKIWRDEKAGLIRASGVFADTEYGALIACALFPELDPEEMGVTASLVSDEVLRGVSVDLAIHNYDVGPRSDWFDEDGNWAPKDTAERAEPSILDMLLGTDEPTIAVVTSAEIGMTTVCPFPAFSEAKIAVGNSLIAGANPAFWTVTMSGGFTAYRKPLSGILTASGRSAGSAAEEDCGCDSEPLTASAAGLAPVAPPSSWFEVEDHEEPYALTVDDDGRVHGYAWLWDVCHIGLPGQCRTAPHSTTDYRYFHLGEIACDDGERVECGQVTLDTGHAGLSLNGASATKHYDDTGTVVAHVRLVETEFGGYVVGALDPNATEEAVRTLRGAKLSGDWRKFSGTGHELVALLAVNVPGFPVPRARASIVASAEGEEVLALVAAGIPLTEDDLSAEEAEQFASLAAQLEFGRLAARAA